MDNNKIFMEIHGAKNILTILQHLEDDIDRFIITDYYKDKIRTYINQLRGLLELGANIKKI